MKRDMAGRKAEMEGAGGEGAARQINCARQDDETGRTDVDSGARSIA